MAGERQARPFSWQESQPSSPAVYDSVPWPSSQSQANATAATAITQAPVSSFASAALDGDHPPPAYTDQDPNHLASQNEGSSSVLRDEKPLSERPSPHEIPVSIEARGPAPLTNRRHSRHGSLQRPLQSPSSAASAPLTPRTESFLRSKFHVDGYDLPHAKSARSSLLQTPSTSSSPRAASISMPTKVLPGTPSVHRPHREQLPRPQYQQTPGPSPSPPPPPPPRKDTPKPDLNQEPPVREGSSSTRTSILSRLSTKAANRVRNPSKYHRLDDEHSQERGISLADMRRSRAYSDHLDVPPGFDLSTFAGSGLPPVPQMNIQISGPDSDQDRDNEDDILEAKGHLTGGLGGGMNRMKSTKLNVPEPTPSPQNQRSPSFSGWMRRKSSARPSEKHPGQRAAEVSGQVVVIDEAEEDIHVDLSNVEGMTGAHTVNTDLDLMADSAIKQSYYFPPDPQMPNWRPFPMSNWYIVLLICIALALAGVQEFLVQLSRRRAPNESLLTFTNPNEVSAGDWFTWKYLPEMILVSYGVMFQATDFEVRRLEPYYQMSKSSGAIASESLNMDYLTFWSYLIPFKAVRHRQWAVVCSSLATILSSALIPVLFSAALNMDPDRTERKPDTRKYVRMDPVWSRILETALLIVAIAGILLLLQLRRKSGLVSDPKGIAGISVMATKSHILNDFRGLDMASHTTIHRQLKHRRYILHKSSLWQGEYLTHNSASDTETPKPRNPHPLALHLKIGVLYLFCLALFIAFIPIIEFTAATKITSVLPWFLTLLATIVKLAWTNLETAIRMIEPFYVLSRRHASPSVLLLDYNGTVPGYMPLKAAYNGHYLLACVGVCSILCEVLTVVVSSFNVDGRQYTDLGKEDKSHDNAETSHSYWASVALALLIPSMLSGVLVAVYMFRRHAFLPRQPGTIASVLAFVAQSRMLYDFVAPNAVPGTDVDTAYSGGGGVGGFGANGTKASNSGTATPNPGLLSRMTGLSRADMGGQRHGGSEEEDVAITAVRRLEAQGKTYGLGWYKGRDGVDHLGVDEEELLASYHHGVDWSKGRVTLGEVGRWDVY